MSDFIILSCIFVFNILFVCYIWYDINKCFKRVNNDLEEIGFDTEKEEWRIDWK